jgi:small GTP-binding protein
MVIKKQEFVSQLLRNYVESQSDVKIAFLFTRKGLLISKYGELDSGKSNSTDGDLEKLYNEISTLLENVLNKIVSEYEIGRFGTGSFETEDYRIIFLEAGPDGILLCVCSSEVNLNKLFPIAYIVVEKIAQILEGSFDPKYSELDIPELAINKQFSLNLANRSVSNGGSFLENVKMEHHLKIGKKVRKVFKLILLGSAAVGKTTLVNSFLKKEQMSDYRPTLGISISTQTYYLQGFKDDQIKFLIYDLAGQDLFKKMRHDYYIGASCAFVVYDITRRETFDEAINFWYKDARKELGDIPFVLVGNKIDLEPQRQVSKEEGMKKAEELCSFFIETSALKNINVKETFKIIGIGLFFKTFEESVEGY